jgi:hypothetical protein
MVRRPFQYFDPTGSTMRNAIDGPGILLSPDEVRAYQPEPPTTGPDLALIRAKRRMVETGQWDGAQGAMILQPLRSKNPSGLGPAFTATFFPKRTT